MTRQRRGISKEILNMITSSIGKPPNSRDAYLPASPSPVAQDATRIVPKRMFVDDTEPEEMTLPTDNRMLPYDAGDIMRAQNDEHSELEHFDALRQRLAALRNIAGGATQSHDGQHMAPWYLQTPGGHVTRPMPDRNTTMPPAQFESVRNQMQANGGVYPSHLRPGYVEAMRDRDSDSRSVTAQEVEEAARRRRRIGGGGR